jgi:hypothetical protein
MSRPGSNVVNILRRRTFAEWFGKHILFTVFVPTGTYAGALPPPPKPDTPAMVQWKALIPTIRDVLTQSGLNCPGGRMDIEIVDASDLTGDGLSYALVDFCPGGAYTDWIVAMQMEQDKPVPARFRKANGEVLDVEFLQGASVMHTVDAKLVPEKKAIYDMFSDNDGAGHLVKCGVKAYVWKASAKAFDLNAQLTKQASRSYCQSPLSISVSAQLQYSDTKSGISFQYPEGYDLKVGDLGDHDTGIGYLGRTPMEFVGSGGVRVVTVEPPVDSYPGTDYVNAFFTVSIDPRLSKGECEKFADDPLAARKLQAVKKISGIEFHGAQVGLGGLGHQFGGFYYHGFSRGSCYELAYGLATAGYGAVDGMKQVDNGKVFSILEKVLSTVTVRLRNSE